VALHGCSPPSWQVSSWQPMKCPMLQYRPPASCALLQLGAGAGPGGGAGVEGTMGNTSSAVSPFPTYRAHTAANKPDVILWVGCS
jgi:hypothetical protein